MYIKKLFYKLTNKDKHFHYKMSLKKEKKSYLKKLYKKEEKGIEKLFENLGPRLTCRVGLYRFIFCTAFSVQNYFLSV